MLPFQTSFLFTLSSWHGSAAATARPGGDGVASTGFVEPDRSVRAVENGEAFDWTVPHGVHQGAGRRVEVSGFLFAD